MTIKGLLGKWTSNIHHHILYALTKYHIKTHNIDSGDKVFTISLFKSTFSGINYLVPVLEDLTSKNLYGIEDIFIAVFGVQSDEVYALRAFLELHSRIDSWDEDYMWTDCKNDKRLYKILIND